MPSLMRQLQHKDCSASNRFWAALMRILFLVCLVVSTGSAQDAKSTEARVSEHAKIKHRYIRFLIGTESTFAGQFGEQASREFLGRLTRPIEQAMAFDFSQDAGAPFRAFPGEPRHPEERRVYSPMLQQFLLSLAYGYCVDVSGSPHYRNPRVLRCYVQCLDYLHGRGIREGMTFHNNANRMHMEGAPKPPPGAANLAEMELRMGALCQSVLLMEPHFGGSPSFDRARALVRHLEMLGRTSGHVRYYEPYENPPQFPYRVQSDAIQNYCDTTLVSALLETDPERRRIALTEASRVFSDSLKIIPGWADTIKPDFTGFHHRGVYGNAYTGGFIPQAAFGVYLLRGTSHAVDRQSIANLQELILTYRLYCQKYAMPFGIRGRMPLSSDHLKTTVFVGVLIYASSLGLDEAGMRPVFARLWDFEELGLDFLFAGGRGKSFRGLYPLEMLEELVDMSLEPEPAPTGFWSKPYAGLALHRRDNWMAAIKGHSKYIWDYENGESDENVYGQYLSHGMLTVFAQGDPVSDIASGYRLNHGWDWYRMPGATAVHFPIAPRGPLEHRRFSPETFLGAVSCDGQNGAWGMLLNEDLFADGRPVGLKARKSAFFVDDLIVLLGSGISSVADEHPVETTLFQCHLTQGGKYRLEPANCLTDPVGNGYYVPDADNLSVFQGKQASYRHDGRTPTEGEYAVAWIDHGIAPHDASYACAILVRGGDSIRQLAENPKSRFRVLEQSDSLHHVDFPTHRMSGFVVFEPSETNHSIVSRLTQPCLVMCRETSEGVLRMAVTNPDLGLLPADAPQPDLRWIGRGDNQYLASQARPVQVTLRGSWRVIEPQTDQVRRSMKGGNTVLDFNCKDGRTIQVNVRRG